jgi:hypothetical protein
MRPRKPILLVTTRGELRFMLRTCNARLAVHSVECREDLKELVASGGCEPVMVVLDIRDMAGKGAEMFVQKIREGFPLVKVLLVAKAGEEQLFGADLIVRDVEGLSAMLVEAVLRLVALKRGPKKALPLAQLQEEWVG